MRRMPFFVHCLLWGVALVAALFLGGILERRENDQACEHIGKRRPWWQIAWKVVHRLLSIAVMLALLAFAPIRCSTPPGECSTNYDKQGAHADCE